MDKSITFLKEPANVILDNMRLATLEILSNTSQKDLFSETLRLEIENKTPKQVRW